MQKTTLGNLKSLFTKMNISPRWLKQTIFLNQKCLAKNLKLFCFRGFHLKCHVQYAFDDNLSVTHVFIKQILREVEVAPTFPLRAVKGWGSICSFQPEAMALVMAMKQ
jgi:hypothetical protein